MTLEETLREIRRLTDEATPAAKRLDEARATLDELSDQYNRRVEKISELRKEAWKKFAEENFPPPLQHIYHR